MNLTGKYFNRKGDITNLIFFIIIIVIIAITYVIGWRLMKVFDDNNSLMSEEGQNVMGKIRNRYVAVVDNSFLIIFGGLFIGMVVGAWFIYNHPAFFWISIPIFAFLIFLAAIFGNMFSNFTLTFTDINDFTIMPFIMNNFVKFIVVVVIVVAIALFAKQVKTNEVV